MRNKGFISLIEMLIVLAIILFLWYTASKFYFNKPLGAGQSEMISKEGFNVSSGKSLIDSTKEKVKQINEDILNKANKTQELDNF